MVYIWMALFGVATFWLWSIVYVGGRDDRYLDDRAQERYIREYKRN